MQRGEIWWAELGEGAGHRPVLLLSRNEAYAVRELVTVAPLTTRIRSIASEVPVGTADGLPKECVINLDTITTIAKSCLSEPITSLSSIKMKQAEEAIRFSVGMEG